MKINELQPRQGNVEIEAVITELGETRTYNKFGRELSVADAVIQDDSGTVKLTLWNDDIARFKSGDKIKVLNGYVNEFQGEMSLTSGKFGKLEKVEGSDGASSETTSSESEVSEEPVGDASAVDGSGEEMSMAEAEVEQSSQENSNEALVGNEEEVSEEIKTDAEEREEVSEASQETETIKPEDLL